MTQTPLPNRLERENKDAIDRLGELASYLTPRLCGSRPCEVGMGQWAQGVFWW